MLFNWFISLYNWVFKRYPIVNIVLVDDNGKQSVLKSNFKSKRIPSAGEILYFNETGPYYIVEKVIHYIGVRHIIYIEVSLFKK